MQTNDKAPPQFYFSLFRALALFRGGNPGRTEQNAFEAWLIGLVIYSIHYAFFAAKFIFPLDLSLWLTALLLVALPFGIWLFWLLFLYLNSLVIQVLRWCGIFRALPTRRAQSILWGITTTAMALDLLETTPFLRELSAFWLTAVALNLAAALFLAFKNASRRPGN